MLRQRVVGVGAWGDENASFVHGGVPRPS
jgi:hypothetical protein